jgi:hypothetical protein
MQVTDYGTRDDATRRFEAAPLALLVVLAVLVVGCALTLMRVAVEVTR